MPTSRPEPIGHTEMTVTFVARRGLTRWAMSVKSELWSTPPA